MVVPRRRSSTRRMPMSIWLTRSDLRRQHRLDRIGQVIVEARAGRRGRTCRTAARRRVRRARPGRSRKSPRSTTAASTISAKPLAAEIAARQHGAQLVLAAPQQFFEIGRRRAGRLRPRAPRALARPAPRSPGPAALIAPRHGLSPRCAGARAAARCSVAGVIGEASPRYNAAASACGVATHRLERPQLIPCRSAWPTLRS